MEYQPKIELGQIVQTVGTLIAALAAIAFAWAFLVSDVDNAQRDISDNKQAITKEEAARQAEDKAIRQEIQRVSIEFKEEVKASEDRQRFLLEDIRDDVKFLARERRNESKSSTE